jgi:hypothetical protein
MVYTRAQAKRKAASDPIYAAPPARRPRSGKTRRSIGDLPDELMLLMIAVIGDQWHYLHILHTLAHVNHQFNRLAVPSFYE